MTSHDPTQLARVAADPGFIAALDQSGGSTPRALAAYGVDDAAWSTEDEMFDLVHAMRARIMTSPAFTGERILGAILFEQTMDRDVEGVATADYLWNQKRVVPFVKTDVGLADDANGVRLMKDNPGLDALLERARDRGIFGTKMRSVVHRADATGVREVVAQQFEIAGRILDAGLMPIIEPEVDIESPEKAEAEDLVLEQILAHLESLGDRQVMLKLTLPESAGHYQPLVDHPKVLRVVALSGGYELDRACSLLAANSGIIASFSRVLTNGLHAGQEQAMFDATLEKTIQQIFEASTT